MKDYRKIRAMQAKAQREHYEGIKEDWRLFHLRERRRAKQYKLRKERAERGDAKSQEWLKRRDELMLLVRAYQAGMGRKHADTPDGWSYGEGRYVRG